MKCRSLILSALLGMVVGVAACREQTTPAPPATGTTDLRQITLLPYSSEEFGISGPGAGGSVEVKPGQFQRHMPGNDLTLLGQVAFPDATAEQVAGTMRLPGPVGSVSAADLSGGFLLYTE